MARTPRTPPYTITNESVTVILQGETYTVKTGDPNYEPARDAVLSARWEDLPLLFSRGLALEKWAQGHFTFRDNHMFFRNQKLPADLNSRMLKMAARGDDPTVLMKFWEMLMENPSYNSVEQLWPFLNQQGICLDTDGYIICYKGVDSKYQSFHADIDGKYVDNTPGQKPWMPRNLVSDQYHVPCHTGYHLGNMSFAQGFNQGYGSRGHRVVVCRVHPKDVVAVDSSNQKMRVNEYEVIGNAGEILPDTVYDIAADGAVKASRAEAGRTERPATSKSANAPRKSVKDAAAGLANKLGPQRGTVKGTAPDPWSPFGDLDAQGLAQQNMANLRKYASQTLKIVGASKLRKFQKNEAGQEVGLVATILKVRGE